MFKRGAADPFRQRRRLLGGVFEWLDKRRVIREERQLREAKASALGHALGRVIGLFYLFAEYCGTILGTITSGFQRVFGRLILEPISKWQLLAEERSARNKKQSVASKAIGGINYKLWRISERLEKHSELIKRLSTPFRFVASIPARCSHLLGAGYESLEKRLQESKYFAWLYYLMYGVRVIFASSYEFSQAWFWTRNFHALLGGIPAILMCIPLVICLVKIPFTSRTALAMQYQKAATEAWREEDFDEVRLCYNKIAQLGVFEDSVQFEQARVLEKQGKLREAYLEMKRLADHQESLAAKLWIANTLLRDVQVTSMTDDQKWAQVQRYLDDVSRFDAENTYARFMQARLLIRQGQPEAAIAMLNEMSTSHPAASTMIAEIEAGRGNLAAAQSALSRILNAYSDSDRLVSWPEYLHLARAKLLAGDVTGMLETTRNAADQYGDDLEFREVLRELYCVAFDGLRTRQLLPQQQLAILEHGMSLEPTSRDYAERLALLAEREPASGEVLTLLCATVPEDELPLSVTYLLGLSAYKRSDFLAARRYFERYVQETPADPTSYNNLAWLLLNTEPRQLDRALELLNVAVEMAPDAAHVRETRGQVFVALQQWQAAVPDLELALNGQPENEEIHRALAQAYERLGQDELARVHRAQGGEVENNL